MHRPATWQRVEASDWHYRAQRRPPIRVDEYSEGTVASRSRSPRRPLSAPSNVDADGTFIPADLFGWDGRTRLQPDVRSEAFNMALRSRTRTAASAPAMRRSRWGMSSVNIAALPEATPIPPPGKKKIGRAPAGKGRAIRRLSTPKAGAQYRAMTIPSDPEGATSPLHPPTRARLEGGELLAAAMGRRERGGGDARNAPSDTATIRTRFSHDPRLHAHRDASDLPQVGLPSIRGSAHAFDTHREERGA